MMYLWPGLPQLWTRGSWSALMVAFLSAAALNLALLCSFGFSELMTPAVRMALWGAVTTAWIAAAGSSVLFESRWPAYEDPEPGKDAFAEAVEHYLKGDYFQAERILTGLLRRNNRDLDARLMLATLMRHTGRNVEAAEQLDLLERCEGAGKWELEIRRERELSTEATADENAGRKGIAEETNDPPPEMMHAA